MVKSIQFHQLRRRLRSKIRYPVLLLLFLIFLHIFAFPCHTEQLQGDDISLSLMLEELFKNHPESSGAHVLEKGEESLLARAWLTDHATKSIDVQYFIWSTDNIGILAAEYLLRAAERGIRVRVIVDDLLIDAPADSMLALASHPNIHVRIYNPKHSVGVSTPERVLNIAGSFRSANQRMHDKTFLVDGRVAITGGRNMADEYYDYDQEYNFRDRDILLLGPVVTDMEKSFESFWQSLYVFPLEKLLKKGKKRLTQERIDRIYADLHAYGSDPTNIVPEVREALSDLPTKFPALIDRLCWGEITFINDNPGKNEGHWLGGGGKSTETLVEAIDQAQQSITIQSPYLVIPTGGIKFFRELVNRGVDIRISTNSLASTDNLQAFSGYSKQRRDILDTGIKVYEFRPDPAIQKDLIDRYELLEKNVPTFAIHAKTMVIDNSLLFVGTFNLDPRSANLNTEVGVLIRNADLARHVEESITRDMRPENSWNAADHPDQHAPLWKRLKIEFWKIFPLKPLL